MTVVMNGHIKGYDFPYYMGVAPWTLDRFLNAAEIIHGDNIKTDHIRGAN